MEANETWDMGLGTLGTRIGNIFGRAGLHSLQDLKDAIVSRALCWTDGDIPTSFHSGTPHFIRNAGPKTWGPALDALERQGFNWREHTRNFHTHELLDQGPVINLRIDRAETLLDALEAITRGLALDIEEARKEILDARSEALRRVRGK